jgi:hypothetical protein
MTNYAGWACHAPWAIKGRWRAAASINALINL